MPAHRMVTQLAAAVTPAIIAVIDVVVETRQGKSRVHSLTSLSKGTFRKAVMGIGARAQSCLAEDSQMFQTLPVWLDLPLAAIGVHPREKKEPEHTFQCHSSCLQNREQEKHPLMKSRS